MKNRRNRWEMIATVKACRRIVYKGVKIMAIMAAGINFGKPNTEFIVESDENGVAQSCRNVDTGIEYVGGGGGGGDFFPNSEEVEVASVSSLNITLSKNYSEIYQIIQEGKTPYFTLTEDQAATVEAFPGRYIINGYGYDDVSDPPNIYIEFAMIYAEMADISNIRYSFSAFSAVENITDPVEFNFN